MLWCIVSLGPKVSNLHLALLLRLATTSRHAFFSPNLTAVLLSNFQMARTRSLIPEGSAGCCGIARSRAFRTARFQGCHDTQSIDEVYYSRQHWCHICPEQSEPFRLRICRVIVVVAYENIDVRAIDQKFWSSRTRAFPFGHSPRCAFHTSKHSAPSSKTLAQGYG